MGDQLSVDIIIDLLNPGDIPIYESVPEEGWRVLGTDMETWEIIKSHKCRVPEFELSGTSQESVVQQILAIIESACLNQRHGGSAIIANRCFAAFAFGKRDPIWIFTGGLIFTPRPANELNMIGSNHFPDFPTRLMVPIL